MYGVRNYYGNLSFKAENVKGTYSEINEDDYTPDGPWKNQDVNPAQSYKSIIDTDTGIG